jgi:hypothetical protein
MKRWTLFVPACLVLLGCQAPETRPNPDREAGFSREQPSGEQPEQVFDGWTVEVSIAPGTVGPIALDVGRVRTAGSSFSHPWIQHAVEFHNQGNRPVFFRDTRGSLFLEGAGGRALLAADEGCGYERRGKKPVRPGACLLYLDAFDIRPGSTARRTVTLFKELRGMEPLAPGRYLWDKVIRFSVGSPDARVRTATIRLTYELLSADG